MRSWYLLLVGSSRMISEQRSANDITKCAAYGANASLDLGSMLESSRKAKRGKRPNSDVRSFRCFRTCRICESPVRSVSGNYAQQAATRLRVTLVGAGTHPGA